MHFLEQYFDLIKTNNMTSLLREQTYIGSYNMPFDREIYHYCDFGHYTEFDYESDPRAVSLEKSVRSVTSAEELLELVSKSDKEKPCGDIAPRCDLGTPPIAFGAVDAKVFDTVSTIVRNSPSFYELPAFSFAQFAGYPHHGIPETMNFAAYYYLSESNSLEGLDLRIYVS